MVTFIIFGLITLALVRIHRSIQTFNFTEAKYKYIMAHWCMNLLLLVPILVTFVIAMVVDHQHA